MFLQNRRPFLSNPLAYPAGIKAGFDPFHFASKGVVNKNGFSLVASGNNFINLLTGFSLNQSGSGNLSVLDSRIGPSVSFPSAGASSLSLSGQSTTAISAMTVASIVTFNVVGTSFQAILSNGSVLVINSSKQIQLYSQTSSTFIPVVGVPYFIAVSKNNTDNKINYVITNLNTGVIYSYTTTSAGALATPSSTPAVGANSGVQQTQGSIAALMYSSNYLSMQQLMTWGQDPWSFWYPRSFTDLFVGSSAGPITATLTVTESNDTLSSTALTTVSATLSVTEQNDSLSSTATSTVSASLTVTEDNDTLSSTGTSTVSATLSVTEQNDTLSSTGVVVSGIVGTLSVTEQNDSLSSTSTTTVSATLAVTENNDSLSSTGFAGSISCSVTITEQNDALSSTGTAGSSLVVGGRQREAIEWGWDWYNAPSPFTVSDIRTSAARLGQLGGIASGKARNR